MGTMQDEWIERLEHAAVDIAVIGCAIILGVIAGAVLEDVLWNSSEIPVRVLMGLLGGGLAARAWKALGHRWMDPDREEWLSESPVEPRSPLFLPPTPTAPRAQHLPGGEAPAQGGPSGRDYPTAAEQRGGSLHATRS